VQAITTTTSDWLKTTFDLHTDSLSEEARGDSSSLHEGLTEVFPVKHWQNSLLGSGNAFE
jgi:hypothetical protein